MKLDKEMFDFIRDTLNNDLTVICGVMQMEHDKNPTKILKWR